jgi:hypothetical protein
MIPTVMKLTTLADVRMLIRHVPAERRERTTWRYVASQLAEAAAGAIDTAHVAVALRLVPMMERRRMPAATTPFACGVLRIYKAGSERR